jgi:Ca2+-binding EF-hand superfamily protein/tRNA A-37 threonylcarbamoyl transferase component Bud32
MPCAVFGTDELFILKKVWLDLSEKTEGQGIDKDTFLTYIPIVGLLGEQLFLMFDKSSNGYISQQDFINGMSVLYMGSFEEHANFLFNTFDVERSGTISKKNLTTLINYIPVDEFCSSYVRRNSLSGSNSEEFKMYTNDFFCEEAFQSDDAKLCYSDFKEWLKHTPAILRYVKSVITDIIANIHYHQDETKKLLWKQGEKTKIIMARYYIVSGNCLYYYNHQFDIRPKGVIFLTGSIIKKHDDNDMKAKGYYGFELFAGYTKSDLTITSNCGTHYHHEKRIFYTKSAKEQNEWIKLLQIASNAIPFEEKYMYDELNDMIGTGKFSKVYKCTEKITKNTYAVKIIDKTIFETDGLDKHHILNEIAILKLVQHPNVIQLKDTFEDSAYIYIVIELIDDGDFFNFINNHSCFKDDELRPIIYQILNALAYLHDFGIAHCDLKPENMLCDRKTGNIVKITDFGLSKMLLSNQSIHEVSGTITYIAPEALQYACYGIETDLWALGVIIYLLTQGKLPFDGNNTNDIIRSIVNDTPSIKSTTSDNIKSLLEALLQKNPKNRITAKQALVHPFFTNSN